MIQPVWRTVCRFLKKLKIELPYDPAIPLLGIYPEETIIQKDTCTPVFTAALFTTARSWKQPKCPSTDEWIKNMWGTPESQLAAGQSSTGRHWNSPKKIPHIQRQRRSHNEMVRGAQSE